MSFYTVEPEVAGELGPGTEFDRSVQPVAVTRMEYQFTNWLGDALLESTPCFIVTEELAQRIGEASLTGAMFGDVEVSVSPEGEELIQQPLPKWRRLKPVGKAYEDDFGLDDDLLLAVSERALSVLREAGLRHADVEENDYRPNPSL
jgi:hypothetical protein